MNTFSLLFQVVIAFVGVSCQQQYVQQQFLGPYPGSVGQFDQQTSDMSSGSSSSSSSSTSQNSQYSNNGQIISGPVTGPAAFPIAGPIAAPLAGPIVGPPTGPAYGPSAANYNYAAVDPKAQNSHISESFHSNKGEILIHRPAPIIVKRPPTKVLVNHPPLVVKPAPVVLHKPPPVIMRKVFVKQHPRPVKVEPVYVNVVKPPAEKYYVNEKASQGAAGVGYNQLHQGQAYLQGPAQFPTGPGPVQYQGPVQFPSGPAQFGVPAQFQGQSLLQQQLNSQSQSQAQAQAQAQAQTQNQNQQQLTLQSDPSQLQFNSQVYPQGLY